MNTTRLEIASRILAGYAANPSIHAGLYTDDDMVSQSLDMADKLIKAHKGLVELETKLAAMKEVAP
jgi:hypothetical protein